eukprot:COSAG02_NODE_10136_length_2013_cov_1.990073_1_plen_60_part_10
MSGDEYESREDDLSWVNCQSVTHIYPIQEKARSRSRGMERVSREMRGTGVQNGGGSVARR